VGEAFVHPDFLLRSASSRRLYHEYAEGLPIFDYHTHLPAGEIAADQRFENLTRLWLSGDHYKWRALRALGVSERLVTGQASDWEKFAAWAGAVPYTVRSPLYHWTHMELKDPFGISDRLLGPDTAAGIYERCNGLLPGAQFGARGLLRHFRVQVLCTTDDPNDSLEHHRALAEERRRGALEVQVLPTFRADRALAVEDPAAFNAWVDRLEQSSGLAIHSYAAFLEALRSRHRFFHAQGCRLSDHGLELPYAEPYRQREIQAAFRRVRGGKLLEPAQARKFKSAVLYELAVLDAEAGWAQQLHLGALRNVSSRLLAALGPDAGGDAIGDFPLAASLARLLDRLDRQGRLARTILYVSNPRDNEVAASIAGCFQDEAARGKIQFGPAWWFNDQLDGMSRQLEALSGIGLLSTFLGMLTDSRSFLSFVRHEYFRRLLCELLGGDVEAGRLPADFPLLGGIVRDVCWGNAVRYFGVSQPGLTPS
jgi:glucuronate isomerase